MSYMLVECDFNHTEVLHMYWTIFIVLNLLGAFYLPNIPFEFRIFWVWMLGVISLFYIGKYIRTVW